MSFEDFTQCLIECHDRDAELGDGRVCQSLIRHYSSAYAQYESVCPPAGGHVRSNRHGSLRLREAETSQSQLTVTRKLH